MEVNKYCNSVTMLSYLITLILSSSILGTIHGFSIPSTNTPKPYAVNLKFSVKPERRDDFLELIKRNQRKTLDLEPASLQYVVGEDVSTSNTFYIHEQFIGEEGFEAHRKMAHASDWATFKNSKPFIEGGEPKTDFYFGEHDIFDQIPLRAAYCVHVELFVKPEFRNEFINVIRNNQKGSTETEPLCMQYVFGESTTKANKFVFHEEYKGDDDGKEGFIVHTTTSHFQKWEEFVGKDPFTRPPIVDFFKSIC